jgi:hypothetical protein
MLARAAESDLVRPFFRVAIQQWPDAVVTSEEANVVEIKRRLPPGTEGSAALVVVGKNRLDTTLFERCAAHRIMCLLEDGWSIKLLDLDHRAGAVDTWPHKPPGVTVARLLLGTQRLRYVLFLTHSRNAINLSDSGNDLIVDDNLSGEATEPGMPIQRLRLSKTAADDGWVDVFGCFCRPKARWSVELANALRWPVRTVYPGYSIYFPADGPNPKSAIPFTRAISGSRYSKRGWAVWLPGSDRPVRVSEPGETARRFDDGFDYLERLFVNAISVGLEPVRDFRKRRLLARQKD